MFKNYFNSEKIQMNPYPFRLVIVTYAVEAERESNVKKMYS